MIFTSVQAKDPNFSSLHKQPGWAAGWSGAVIHCPLSTPLSLSVQSVHHPSGDVEKFETDIAHAPDGPTCTPPLTWSDPSTWIPSPVSSCTASELSHLWHPPQQGILLDECRKKSAKVLLCQIRRKGGSRGSWGQPGTKTSRCKKHLWPTLFPSRQRQSSKR